MSGKESLDAVGRWRLLKEYESLPRGPTGKLLHGRLMNLAAKWGLTRDNVLDAVRKARQEREEESLCKR